MIYWNLLSEQSTLFNTTIKKEKKSIALVEIESIHNNAL